MDVYGSGDGPGALFLLKKLAKDGCGVALSEIAAIYETGCPWGVIPDLEEAIKWRLYSIETMDDWFSHLNIGILYFEKLRQTSRNFYLPRYHLDLVIDTNNDMRALYVRGLIEYETNGLTPEALSFFHRASEQEHYRTKMFLLRINKNLNWLEKLSQELKLRYSMAKIALNDRFDPRISLLVSMRY